MMTDGLYLDDATQRGGEREVARKKQKGNISALTTRSNREDKLNMKVPHRIAIGANFLDFNKPTSSNVPNCHKL